MRSMVLGSALLGGTLALTLATGFAKEAEEGGLRVRVSVSATDSSGGRLHYRWRSTDGTIADINSPSTIWNLPEGPGLHFAYVLVSNGLGGYTERRVGVNTDNIPSEHESEHEEGPDLAPPHAPAQVGDYFRGFINLGLARKQNHNVYAPLVQAYLQDPNSNARYPPTGNAVTDNRGEFLIPGVPLGSPNGYSYNMNCSVDGGATFQLCDTSGKMLNTATPDYFDTYLFESGNYPISGTFVLTDGTPCGLQDEFFGVHSNATATLFDANHNILAGPVPVNEFGDFGFPSAARATSILLRCEGAPAILANTTVAGISGGDGGSTLLTGVRPPTITSMAAKFNDKSVGTFLPPPSGFASDILIRSDGFLAVKGIDSRKSACQYYKAVGAVQGCDEGGRFTGAVLTYDSWQRQQRIGSYAKRGAPQYQAAFVNRADLNLAREHKSISYGPNDTAAVVCNHLGPPAATSDQLLNPLQTDIDAAVLNAIDGRNLLACVAMDYTSTPGVNNGQPFVRFLIFGPSGALLPSVNLDGRAEKFLPGTCVVCHGGDHYQGKFPEDGSGFANIGGHFLPYDTGNFEFADVRGLSEADQEESIYHLNQNVLHTGPTLAERELVAGWYKDSHALDKDYLPDSWKTPIDPQAIPGSAALQTYKDFYTHVIARSCRTCHAAMIEAYNFDHEYTIDPIAGTSPLFDFHDANHDMQRSICGGHSNIERDWMMPNSLVTFNRLWASSGTTDDQVAYMNNYLALDGHACLTKPSPSTDGL